jgi:hypothetical protein
MSHPTTWQGLVFRNARVRRKIAKWAGYWFWIFCEVRFKNIVLANRTILCEQQIVSGLMLSGVTTIRYDLICLKALSACMVTRPFTRTSVSSSQTMIY